MRTSAFEEMQRRQDATSLFDHVEHFFQRYAPQDRADAARFHADLHMLLRRIHADAQEPYMRHLEAIVAAMPPLFPIKT